MKIVPVNAHSITVPDENKLRCHGLPDALSKVVYLVTGETGAGNFLAAFLVAFPTRRLSQVQSLASPLEAP